MSDRMVIDVSVAFKWFLRDAVEEDTDLAEDILVALLSGELELHAPRIFTYEVCGALAKACKWRVAETKRFRLTKEEALRCARELFGLPIHIAEATETEGCRALEMAVDYSKGHYDMTYVHLAEQLECQWCTCDSKADQAVPPDFPRSRILHLSSTRG